MNRNVGIFHLSLKSAFTRERSFRLVVRKARREREGEEQIYVPGTFPVAFPLASTKEMAVSVFFLFWGPHLPSSLLLEVPGTKHLTTKSSKRWQLFRSQSRN